MIAALYRDTTEDVDVIVSQADRIMRLLDRMRTAAQERLKEAHARPFEGIPASPEEFEDDENN